MTQRLLGSAIGAILVTLALVTLMQSLVAMGGGGLNKNKGVRIQDFLRTMDDSDTQSKKRELPDKEEVEEAPEMEAMEMETAPSELKMDGLGISAQPDLSLAGGVGVGSADMDTVPLVRVNPRYPPRALAFPGADGAPLYAPAVQLGAPPTGKDALEFAHLAARGDDGAAAARAERLDDAAVSADLAAFRGANPAAALGAITATRLG